MRCDINQNSMLPSLLLPALKPKNKVDIDRKFELEKINNTVVVKKASTIRKPVVYKSPEEEKLVKSSTIKIQELPPLQKELHVGEWHLGAVLGKGASGIVRCGVNYITGEKAAIKIIKRPQIDHGKNRHEEEERVQRQEMYLIREVFIAYSLRHQNINRLRNIYLNEENFYCVYEFIPGIDLVDHLTQNGAMREREARFVFRQILSAIEHAHRNNVVHRDLKFENMRYDVSNGMIYLFDFGLSTFHNFSQKENRKDFYDLMLKTNCGSPCYASPEIYDGVNYWGPEVDIWSLGVCLYAMTVGVLPFYGESFEILSSKIKSGKIEFPDHLSSDLVSLIGKILQPNSKNRATLKEIVEDQWVNAGYQTLPIDYMELETKPTTPMIPLPVLQKSTQDDFRGPGLRCHPFWNTTKKNKKLVVSNKKVLKTDKFRNLSEFQVGKLMMEILRKNSVGSNFYEGKFLLETKTEFNTVINIQSLKKGVESSIIKIDGGFENLDFNNFDSNYNNDDAKTFIYKRKPAYEKDENPSNCIKKNKNFFASGNNFFGKVIKLFNNKKK
ncbi:serine/threonine-protein kinase KIN2 [Lobulomyces angularis]|nr:serine/threonine-protein kinase KIN2 [Lobulomyces angularis]